jgi:hypothetical protein
MSCICQGSEKLPLPASAPLAYRRVAAIYRGIETNCLDANIPDQKAEL